MPAGVGRLIVGPLLLGLIAFTTSLTATTRDGAIRSTAVASRVPRDKQSLLLPPAREAAPFGLTRGMTEAQFGLRLKKRAGGMYELATVPEPNPAFAYYLVEIGPTTGLCFVKAVGKEVTTSVDGIQLRSQFSRVRDELALTYGQYGETNRLLQGSMWHEPLDWMMGLVKEERLILAVWSPDTGANLAPGLREIFLTVSALSTHRGYVVLEYYFDNEDQCDREIDR